MSIELKEALKGGIVEVKFTKADGSIREGKFTLSDSLIPARPASEGSTRTRKKAEGVTAVYEIDNGWRSFRDDRVIEWKVVSE